MSTPYARISITLPAEDLAAADRLAAQQDRSRSWIVAEAIRRYAAGGASSGEAGNPTQALGSSRTRQLERDLRLSAADRVREAEDVANQVSTVGLEGNAPLEEPLRFADYAAFEAWRRAHSAP